MSLRSNLTLLHFCSHGADCATRTLSHVIIRVGDADEPEKGARTTLIEVDRTRSNSGRCKIYKGSYRTMRRRIDSKAAELLDGPVTELTRSHIVGAPGGMNDLFDLLRDCLDTDRFRNTKSLRERLVNNLDWMEAIGYGAQSSATRAASAVSEKMNTQAPNMTHTSQLYGTW